MKPKLFSEHNYTAQELLDNLEANSYNVQENHIFLKGFTDEELEEKKEEHLNLSKKLTQLNAKLKSLVEPLKMEIKLAVKQREQLIQNIAKGGEDVTERVFLFADYTDKVMGIYDSRALLISTRPFTMQERQLALNSSKTFHLENREAV